MTVQQTASESLHLAQSRVQNNPEDERAWEALYVAWANLGEAAGAWHALQEWARIAPNQMNVVIRSIQFLMGAKDTQQALMYAEKALIQYPEHPTLLRLGIETALIESKAAFVHQWALQLLQHHPNQSVFVARALSRADQWTEAMTILASWLLQHPDDSSAWALKAELHLWAGGSNAANHAAGRALAEDPQQPLAQLVVAILQFRCGDFANAWSTFGHLPIPSHTHGMMELEASTIWCWRSLVQYEMGHLDGAVNDAKRALHSPGPLNLAAQILRSKMTFHQNMKRASQRRKKRPGFEINSMDRVVDIWSYREILPRIEPLLTHPAQAWSGVQRDLLDAYTDSLGQLGDNLSPTSTHFLESGGPPRVFHPPPLIRAKARRLQHLLRTRSPDTVLDRYRDLQREHPDAITPYTYMGEILIWLGRTTEAKNQLQNAIDRDLTTQWAWIGLGAAELLEGHPEKAIERFAQGIECCRFEGPTMFVYRAECWLRIGHLERALSDVDAALASKPQRLSAWLLRARIDSEMGDHDLGNELMQVLAERIPHLHESMTKQNSSITQSIQWALQAMNGNRSSSLPFFQRQRNASLSFLRWGRQDWQTLRSHLRPQPTTKPSIWWETKPDQCRLGDCGPRCAGNEQLQAWMGPSVGLARWIQSSDASQPLKDHANTYLNHLQSQRRQVCPDLPDLALRVKTLMTHIKHEQLLSLEVTQLCDQLSACALQNR